jgi:hypothetical protein
MRALQVIYLFVSLSLISGCGITAHNYSVETESLYENALLDGLPNGVNITTVNTVLLKRLNNKLTTRGMNNNTKNIFKAKYEIEYFGHRFIPIQVRYIIRYNLELSNKLNGKVFYSKGLEEIDSDLDDLIDDVANTIIDKILDEENNLTE